MKPRREQPDYYAIMQLSPSATAAELKQRYRELVKLYHPDVNGGDPVAEERFKQVQAAYHVLHTPALRELYDLDYLSWQDTAPPDQTSSIHPKMQRMRADQFDELRNIPHVTRMHARRNRDGIPRSAGLYTRGRGIIRPELKRRNLDTPTFITVIFYLYFAMVVVSTLIMLFNAFVR